MDEADDLIDRGVDLQLAGRPDEAAGLYRRAIELDPAAADAHNLLGTVHSMNKQWDDAIAAHRRAIGLDATDPSYFNNLALALRNAGRAAEAVEALRTAVALDPSLPQPWQQLGQLLPTLGDKAGAADAYAHAAEGLANNAAVWNDYGVALRDADRPGDAVDAFRRALTLAPAQHRTRDHLVRALVDAGRLDEAVEQAAALRQSLPDKPWPHTLYAITLNMVGRHEDAIDPAADALRKTPDDVESHFQMAVAFQALGELKGASRALDRCLELDPKLVPALNRQAILLTALGQPAPAADLLEQAAILDSDNYETFQNQAHVLLALQRNDDALSAARRSVELAPDLTEPAFRLAVVLSRKGFHSECARVLQDVVARDPADDRVKLLLATTYGERGQVAEAIGMLDELAAAARPPRGVLHSLAMMTNYLDAYAPAERLAYHQRWLGASDLATAKRHAPRPRRRERPDKIRVGYVSPDFRAHSVAFFLLPLLAHHDKSRFEITCFDNTHSLDPVSGDLFRHADHVERIVQVPDAKAAETVLGREIDILVDLAGHTGENRLGLFAHRAAPVQVSYLGYPNTTGSPEIGWRLVDAVTDPPGADEAFYAEKLYRLPRCFLAFLPASNAPEIAPPPSDAAGHVTFGSFNNFAKVSERTVRLWSRVLDGVPGSRLLIKGNGMSDPATDAVVRGRFAAAGLDPDRVVLVERARTTAEHLAQYHRVDLALDTFPYNGTTTTCEALWMGVPVLTYAGGRHAERVSASLLRATGLGELCGDDADDFVRRAVALAGDADRRRDLRRAMRQRMSTSELMDHAGLARAVEAAYEHVHAAAFA